jgi:hypothetical protein
LVLVAPLERAMTLTGHAHSHAHARAGSPRLAA